MTDLLTLLESFNRKERFILMTQASAGAVPLGVSAQFRERLNAVLPETVQVPDLDRVTYVLAMDFHLNWLAAALQLAYRGKSVNEDLAQSSNESAGQISGAPKGKAFERNQEDIDLLLGWVAGERTKLVLVEAKAHTSWQTGQVASKSARFAAIFGTNGQTYADAPVDVAFVLAGFKTPKQPQFMKAWDQFALRETGTHSKTRRFIPLDIPSEVLVVGEHDGQGNSQTNGGHWRVSRKQFTAPGPKTPG
ncbi:hypothetical protein [Ornithinimicrobium sp. W1665]|uniref:hypothetical protein n=1 Tax=Ornithinimicrobium sp. W1665 TaxID=3416666 RepID=UPI003CEF2EEC